ncbi:MAG: YraN family protein [Chloroflexota bacterium]|nr:YraN family protein [Chloroflexota bacterium]MDQ5866048.1 YraN family protein [Chloroflexota bacterium]
MADESGNNSSDQRRTVGGRGEDIAALYLRRRGCTILARRWYANPGEIDIIASCPSRPMGTDALSLERSPTLAFVEVRTRHGHEGLAEGSISQRKANSMVSAAYAYMAAHNLDPEAVPWRIDLVAVTMLGGKVTDINWVKGAIEE